MIHLRHYHGRFHCWCLALGPFDVPIWPYRRKRPFLLTSSRREALRQLLETDAKTSAGR